MRGFHKLHQNKLPVRTEYFHTLISSKAELEQEKRDPPTCATPRA